MSRTALLPENRPINFEELQRGWEESRMTQAEAALLLGVCDRAFRHYRDQYAEFTVL